jgi:hypothetical protein
MELQELDNCIYARSNTLHPSGHCNTRNDAEAEHDGVRVLKHDTERYDEWELNDKEEPTTEPCSSSRGVEQALMSFKLLHAQDGVRLLNGLNVHHLLLLTVNRRQERRALVRTLAFRSRITVCRTPRISCEPLIK